MNQREDAVTFHGRPLTLIGPELQTGAPAPDFALLDNDLNVVTLASSRGKVRIISVVPSLDTPVCDIQTRRFNQAAAELGDEAVVLTVSMDLPFAQRRWCGAAGVDGVVTLSDHRDASFGAAYGVLIEELRLLARSVFVIDREGVIRYIERVEELTSQVDFDAALDAARGALG